MWQTQPSDEMLDLIDRIPEDNQTTAWIEKTPMHLYFISLIQHADPKVYPCR